MNKFITISILFVFIFTLLYCFETNGQIREIKKKSKSNKSSKSTTNSTSSSSSSEDEDEEEDDDYFYDSDEDNYYFGESEGCTGFASFFNNIFVQYGSSCKYSKEKHGPHPLGDSIIGLSEKVHFAKVNSSSNGSIDIDASSALLFHKGIDKIYTYVDYLPAITVNISAVSFTYRYNILTENTNGYPDSFKSWELLLLIDLSYNQHFDIIIGTGIHREEFSNTSFHEYYLGTKLPLSKHSDHFVGNVRFSADYETRICPFFEINSKYNKRFLEFEHLSGYISLGLVYQNYYASHDIIGFCGGVLLNLH